MSGLRHAAILAACAALVSGLAVLAIVDPFHLRYARWFTAGLVLLALVLAVAAFAVAARRGLVRLLVLVIGGVAVLGWIAVVVVASWTTVDNRVVSEVADGRARLVVVEGAPAASGPVFAVVLRAGSGPFAQESVVYQGREGIPPPDVVRFIDADTVEVSTPGGCRYRSGFDPVTLGVDPVHRPLQAGGC